MTDSRSSLQQRRVLRGWWLARLIVDSTDVMYAWLEIRPVSGSRFQVRAPFEVYRRILTPWKFFRAFLFSSVVRSRSTVRVARGYIRHVERDLKLTGSAHTIVGSMSFQGTYGASDFSGVLNGRLISATFESEWKPERYKLRDYTAISTEISRCIREKFFDPTLLENREWALFFLVLAEVAPDLEDDLQLWAALRILVAPLSISHLGLTRPECVMAVERKKRLAVEKLSAETTLLKVVAFSATDVRVWKQVMSDVVSTEVRNLIIDLRSCVGGDYSSVHILSYLLDTPDCVGYLVGRKYYEIHGGQPGRETLHAASRFWNDDLEELNRLLRDEGLLAGWVLPSDVKFTGRLFLLTGEATASAAEALVDYVRENHLATVVGSRTAGCVLSSQDFPVGDGWLLRVPVAVYLSSDGRKVEGAGVEPHISVHEDRALDVALKCIARANELE